MLINESYGLSILQCTIAHNHFFLFQIKRHHMLWVTNKISLSLIRTYILHFRPSPFEISGSENKDSLAMVGCALVFLHKVLYVYGTDLFNMSSANVLKVYTRILLSINVQDKPRDQHIPELCPLCVNVNAEKSQSV